MSWNRKQSLLIIVLFSLLFTFTLIPTSPPSVNAHPLSQYPTVLLNPDKDMQFLSELFDLRLLSQINQRSTSNLTQPNSTLTVTSPSPTVIELHSVYYGPHVTVNLTIDELDIPGFPSLKIRETQLLFEQLAVQETYGNIDENDTIRAGWNVDSYPPEDYIYIYLEKGLEVTIFTEFGDWTDEEGGQLQHQGDIDVFCWPPGVAHTYANSLIGCRGANPEIHVFMTPVTGNYSIGIDYYNGNIPMGWCCLVAWSIFPLNVTALGRTVIADTADIGNNKPGDLQWRIRTGTSLDEDDNFSSLSIRNVTFINFFPPQVRILSPLPGDEYNWLNPITIQWTSNDPNTDEILQYSVEISNNTGHSWKTIVWGTTATETTWLPSDPFYGFPGGYSFLVRVNCTDGRYTVSDTSTGTWTVRPGGPPPPPPWELIVFILVSGFVIVDLAIVLIITWVRQFLKGRREKPAK